MSETFIQSMTNIFVVLGVLLVSFPWACGQITKGIRVLKQASWEAVDDERLKQVSAMHPGNLGGPEGGI